MTTDQALSVRMDKMQRDIEVLKTALVDQARMLHAANDKLREVTSAEPALDSDRGTDGERL